MAIDGRPEYHLHDDYSLTPAYVLGYAFHALQRVDGDSRAHGRRGVVSLLTELHGTIAALGLTTSLAAAGPLSAERDSLAAAHATRIGAASAARILALLPLVGDAVHSELRARGTTVPSSTSAGSPSLHVLLGNVALARCPVALRAEVNEACRALDAHLYTASVFHFHRVWDQLPGGDAAVIDARGRVIADPRDDAALQSSRADALGLLAAVRARLELEP